MKFSSVGKNVVSPKKLQLKKSFLQKQIPKWFDSEHVYDIKNFNGGILFLLGMLFQHLQFEFECFGLYPTVLPTAYMSTNAIAVILSTILRGISDNQIRIEVVAWPKKNTF